MADRAALAEQVDRVPIGAGPSGAEFVEVRTGRPARPSSVQEWTARRLAHLEHFRAWPAAGAVIALLEAGADADVKAAGRDLDEWARHGVLTALGELVSAARAEYPPAAALVTRIRAAWVRKWGDAEPYPPPRPREPAPAARRPVTAMVDDPPDGEHVRAVWDRLEPGSGPWLAGRAGA